MSLAHDLAAAGLRALPPETAHEAALSGLALGLGPRLRADRYPRLRTQLAGMDLPNPIGLAAGFDKDARAVSALLRCGFGFVECGTLTPAPQIGNPKPRLFRLMEDCGVINRMGFNNGGLDAAAERLERPRAKGVVGVNIGANKDSRDRVADYVTGLQKVWPSASYVTVNISSPNTPGLRGLQERGVLEDLVARLSARRSALGSWQGSRPIFLKVAPDLDISSIAYIADVAVSYQLDGLIVSNTTIARPESLQSPHRDETGGLSGAPLFELSTEVLKLFAQAVEGRIALIGAGGVCDGTTALAKIKAGASVVQLYSALAFKGVGLVAKIARQLDALLAAEGYSSVADAVGADLR